MAKALAHKAYIEDMAFWGFNNLWTWFDMNWYDADFDRDPLSRGSEMVARIRRINAKAAGLGLTVGMIGLSNEGFSHQPPPELRADSSDRRGGVYPDSAICASKPGGLELILRNRRKMVELIGPIDVFATWPYDQGGCNCSLCRPWPKRFLEIAPDIAREVHRVSPKARFYVATWMFRDDEMGLVQALAAQRPAWLNGFLTDTAWAGKFDPPAGLARLVFPEISMAGSLFTGYGASGANPMQTRFVEEAARVTANGFGALAYSEGIYDDVNKVTWARSLWSPGRPARDIVRDYAAYHFGTPQLAAWERLIAGLEANWPQSELDKKDPAAVHALFREAERLGRLLPPDPAARVRWHYLRDRAELDSRMVAVGSDTPLMRDLFALLNECGYTRDFPAFRARLKAYSDRVRARAEGVDALFDAYWAYLKRAHLERSPALVITPPPFMGQRDWDMLLAALDRAQAEPDDERMRLLVLAGIKKWFWHNNVSIEALFL